MFPPVVPDGNEALLGWYSKKMYSKPIAVGSTKTIFRMSGFTDNLQRNHLEGMPDVENTHKYMCFSIYGNPKTSGLL